MKRETYRIPRRLGVFVCVCGVRLVDAERLDARAGGGQCIRKPTVIPMCRPVKFGTTERGPKSTQIGLNLVEIAQIGPRPGPIWPKSGRCRSTSVGCGPKLAEIDRNRLVSAKLAQFDTCPKSIEFGQPGHRPDLARHRKIWNKIGPAEVDRSQSTLAGRRMEMTQHKILGVVFGQMLGDFGACIDSSGLVWLHSRPR